MALQWNFKTDLMGEMTVKQNNREFKVNIYSGNALAIFLYEYKDLHGSDSYMLYNFFADEQLCENLLKNRKGLFGDEILNIKLDLSYKNARRLLPYLMKDGYKVICYSTKENNT